jgi:hypothetical protein
MMAGIVKKSNDEIAEAHRRSGTTSIKTNTTKPTVKNTLDKPSALLDTLLNEYYEQKTTQRKHSCKVIRRRY